MPCTNRVPQLNSVNVLSIDDDIVNGGSRIVNIDQLATSEVGCHKLHIIHFLFKCISYMLNFYLRWVGFGFMRQLRTL